MGWFGLMVILAMGLGGIERQLHAMNVRADAATAAQCETRDGM